LGWWILSNFDFQIYAGLNIFFGMASIGLLTVVAMDRYLTMCRPDVGNSMFLSEAVYHLLVTQHMFNLKYKQQFVSRVSLISLPKVLMASYNI
jgi:visual pigment-like receptor peropsin